MPIQRARALTLPCGTVLWLLPGRAVWWPEARSLFVADVHFGKAASFRHAGQPCPRAPRPTTSPGWMRCSPPPAHSGWVFWATFACARRATRPVAATARLAGATRAVAMDLVLGNHDRHAGTPPADLNIALQEEPWAPVPACPCGQRTTRRPWRGTPCWRGICIPRWCCTARRGTACAYPVLHGSQGHQGCWCCPPSAPSPARTPTPCPQAHGPMPLRARGWCRCPAVDGLLRRPFGHAGVQRRGRYSGTKAQPLPKVASSAGHWLAMLAGVGWVPSSTQRSRAAISVG